MFNIVAENNFHNKNYSYNSSNLYPTDNKNFTTPYSLNSRSHMLNTFPELEVQEYELVHKDQQIYLESYREYFIKVKERMIKEYNIKESDLNEGKIHIMVVSFETTSFDLDEICLVDPSKSFHKLKLKFDDCEEAKSKFDFFNGQVLKVEGHIKDNEIYPTDLIEGLPLISYSLMESNVNSFYKENAPYGIYTIFGPFFGNKELDFTLFSRTLNKIMLENPHVLIIGGPFLPVDNEIIKSGYCELIIKGNQKRSFSFFEIFQMFLERINDTFKVSNDIIILYHLFYIS